MEAEKQKVVAEVMNRETSPAQEMCQMPRYRCHKEVWALKIKEVIDPTQPNCETDGSRILVPDDERYGAFRVKHDFVRKHNPQAGGYYVAYKDGYTSFSPAQAFEEGYTLA